MSYKFKIVNIHKLEKSKLIILDGEILGGTIIVNSHAIIKNSDKSIFVEIIGLVLDINPNDKELVSVSIRLNKETLDLFKVGDILISKK